jgi:aspartate aminotransferase-like enzyme/GNAT superfamily N-acetyltransferase
MVQIGEYVFKRADTPEELEQIHCLNYRTFVSEIPQHDDPGTGRLVDKFHDKNVYFIASCKGRLLGMVSAHDRPPFSVADRLGDPTLLQGPGTRPLEVRLLAVVPEKRKTVITYGLLWSLLEHARVRGYTHLYISGVESRLSLYLQLGFEPLGPAVACGGARFVPMRASVQAMAARHERSIQLWHKRAGLANGLPPRPVCLLPGPVAIAAAVHAAFHRPPIYHRGPEFVALFEQVRLSLGRLAGAPDVALLNGSGTLANEAVAAVLAAEPGRGRGILLVNGEFGQRLVSQAIRFGIDPHVLEWAWGKPWDLNQVEGVLAREPPGSWVWGVHQESSTGVLNDLPGLVRLARARGIRVCVDCISSLGAVPLDLGDVYLATGTSGKSLGSYAGVAVVFADRRTLGHVDPSRTPSYLDLTATLESIGPRFTFPSSTLFALETALAEYGTRDGARTRYERYAAQGAYVRQQLRSAGLPPLADEACACPVVTTFVPPLGESSHAFVARCLEWGYAIGGQSGYLAERTLVQIATMGDVTRKACDPLFEHLQGYLAEARQGNNAPRNPSRAERSAELVGNG